MARKWWMAVVLAGMVALTALSGGISPVGAQSISRPWTAVGSSGTVDDASLDKVDFVTRFAQVKSSAPLPTTAMLRYNVVAVDGLFGGDGIGLSARYLDNGGGSQVVVRLIESNVNTGSFRTLVTLDSNGTGRPQSPAIGLQHESNCNARFDFFNNVYWVEVELTKTTVAGRPGVEALRLESHTCIA